MKKLTKLLIIGFLIMMVVNIGFATMQKLADNIPTVQAQDEPAEAEEGAGEGEPEAGEGEAEEDGTPADQPEITSPDEIADTLSQGARSLLLRFSDLLSVVLQMLNYLLWPILMMIGALMDNSIIFGGGMEDRLLQIWSQIRNIVNLLFVVILIGMALYNVLGIGEEGNYTIKKILPKFIIALIVVNFTFVGAKVVLDAANVATNAVFALPNSVEDEFNLTRIDQLEQAVCGHLEDMGSYGGNINLQGEGDYSMCADDSTFTANARQFFQRLSSNNIALVMAVNLGQIHEGIKVSELVRQEPSVTNLTINILFSILIYIVYAVSFIALFIVLIVRVVVLWFIIALSPFAAVAIVLPDLASGGGNFNLKDEFIKHLTAPIIIGFGMTVGYLMLDAYHATTGNALGIQLGEQFANGFSGMSTLQQLLIGIGAVAIVWVVTFYAANNTMAAGITRTIEGSLKRVGTNIAQLPLTIPIIPVPDGMGALDANGNRTNKASLFNFSRTIQEAARGNERGRDSLLDRTAASAAGAGAGAGVTLANLERIASRPSSITTGQGAEGLRLVRHSDPYQIKTNGTGILNLTQKAHRDNQLNANTLPNIEGFFRENQDLLELRYDQWPSDKRQIFEGYLRGDSNLDARPGTTATPTEEPAAIELPQPRQLDETEIASLSESSQNRYNVLRGRNWSDLNQSEQEELLSLVNSATN